MMGGDAGSQEDMFAKLEAMRAVITEVNTQFKDPVQMYPIRFCPNSHLLCRRKQHSFVYASPSSFLCMKPNDWCKS